MLFLHNPFLVPTYGQETEMDSSQKAVANFQPYFRVAYV